MRHFFLILTISLFTCTGSFSQKAFDEVSDAVKAAIWNDNGMEDFFGRRLPYDSILLLRVESEKGNAYVHGVRSQKPPVITNGSNLRPVTYWPIVYNGKPITHTRKNRFTGKLETCRLGMKVDCENLVLIPYDPPKPKPPAPKPPPPPIIPRDTTITLVDSFVNVFEHNHRVTIYDCVSQIWRKDSVGVFNRRVEEHILTDVVHLDNWTVTIKRINRNIVMERNVYHMEVLPKCDEVSIRTVVRVVREPYPVYVGTYQVNRGRLINYRSGGFSRRTVVVNRGGGYSHPVYNYQPRPHNNPYVRACPQRYYPNIYDRFTGAPGTRGNGPSRWPR